MNRFDRGQMRMNDLEKQIKESSGKIDEVHSNTKDLVEIIQSVKGGLKILEHLGRLLKIVSSIAAGAYALYALVTGKVPKL